MTKKRVSKRDKSVCCDEEKQLCEPCTYEEHLENILDQE